MPKTLLLADDSVTIQKVVGISFANEDVALLTVDNGDDAIARAREARPDIVLADVVMPGMNGYEVCEAIKSDPQLRDTPVLLLTGTFEAFDEERAARAGADGHITKPFEAQALVDQVNARLAQATASVPAAEPAPISAAPAPPQQTPAPEDSALGLSAAPDTRSEDGASFDFFDEEITEPRTTSAPDMSAETIVVSDDLEVDGAGEDAFDFEASDELDANLSTSPPSSPGAEVDAPLAMPESLEEPEMDAESGGTLLIGDDPFSGDLAGPPETAPTLGESDLAQVEPEEPPVIPAAATPFEDFTSDLPEAPVPTRVMHEAATLDVGPDAMNQAVSGHPDETLILSDLHSDPIGDPVAGDAFDIAETAQPEDPPADPLAEAGSDDLAVEAVLDPAGGRDFDVSSSDLGDPLQGPETTPEAAEETPSSPWTAEPPALEEAELFSEPAPEEAPEAAPDLLVTPAENAPSATSTPDLSPLAREQLHDALEKIAWEAFGDVTERIVKEALERIERVAWEVIPQMAEALIQEEIRKLKGED